MKRQLKISEMERYALAVAAEDKLHACVRLLAKAGCRQSLPRVRACLKSVQGAVRHAYNRAANEERNTR